MAHGKACYSLDEGTAKHRVQHKEHRAGHMASYTYCECSSSHMAAYRVDNHECKALCTCESKLADAHTGEHKDDGSVPENSSGNHLCSHGRILADVYMESYS